VMLGIVMLGIVMLGIVAHLDGPWRTISASGERSCPFAR